MKVPCIVLFFLWCFPSHAQTITTIAGTGAGGYFGDGGPATAATFEALCGIAVDNHNNIYLADWVNDVIRKVDNSGMITRFAGTGYLGLGGDGGPATAAQLNLNLTVGFAFDSAGDIFFADGDRIRTVNSSGIISTVAGNGAFDYSGDGGPATAAAFRGTTGICFDKSGNLLISDEGNNVIRMVNTVGMISTIAGTTAGFSGDGGPATNAQLTEPYGIAVDDSGNIYVASDLRIRKIDTYGIITTFAGGVVAGGWCEGCPADFALTGIGLAIHDLINVYISDISGDMVYRINKNGKAYTVAGSNYEGYAGDGGPATLAKLHAPTMICFDNDGNLLIADKNNGRVRKVWLGTDYVSPLPVVTPASGLYIYPDPIIGNRFTCNISSDINEEGRLMVYNILGQVVLTANCMTNQPTDFSFNEPPGVYFVTVHTAAKKMIAKLMVN